jgi:NADPH2:quinone reductase
VLAGLQDLVDDLLRTADHQGTGRPGDCPELVRSHEPPPAALCLGAQVLAVVGVQDLAGILGGSGYEELAGDAQPELVRDVAALGAGLPVVLDKRECAADVSTDQTQNHRQAEATGSFGARERAADTEPEWQLLLEWARPQWCKRPQRRSMVPSMVVEVAMKAIQISSYGGPEVLRYVDLPEPVEREGHTLIRVSRAGVNYADTHATENTYLTPTKLPLVPGGEVAGTAPDGRRVVALVPSGGYAEIASAADPLVFDIPEGISDEQALALVLQGVTAWHLLHTSTRLQAGESVVVHAAAGGVGSIAVQLAKVLEAGKVIATASTSDKREFALTLGADVALDVGAPDLKARLIEAAGGPVDVVLEMVGGSVFDESLRALAPFGRLATFGMASRRPAKPLDPVRLMAASRTVAGFWLGHCFRQPSMIAEPLKELFRLTQEGLVRPVVGGTYPLAEARRAHEDILGRGTSGKLVLDPTPEP